MRGLRVLRREQVAKVMRHLALPNRPIMLTADREQLTYPQIFSLEVKPGPSLQNSDGTFKFLMDYDPLDGGIS